MSKRFKINKGYISQRIGEKTTIFAGDESILYTLNDVGGFILEGIKLGWETNMIALRLTEKFQIDHKTALKDVNHFLDTLLAKKIISSK